MQVERVFPFRKTRYQKDDKYRNILAKKSGNSPKNLSSIIGQKELTQLLKSSSSDSFDPNVNVKGQASFDDMLKMAKGNFAFNLHIHTTYSDGTMTPIELLDMSAKYADFLNKYTGDFFTIAITDHDIMDANIDIIDEVAKNPDKYKNLKVVLGVELSAQYVDNNKLKEPFIYEMIGYCINPYDKKSKNFLENLRKTRIEFSKKVIKEASRKYPEYNFSYEEACRFGKNPKKGINGFLYTLADYFKSKAPDIDAYDLALKYLPTNKKQDPIICYEGFDIAKAFENNCGFFGIAHPARINIPSYIIKGNISAYEIIDDFIKYLQKTFKNKFKAIETRYQSYTGSLFHANKIIDNKEEYNDKYINPINWLLNFKKIAQDNSLIETGGLDTHRENPFIN